VELTGRPRKRAENLHAQPLKASLLEAFADAGQKPIKGRKCKIDGDAGVPSAYSDPACACGPKHPAAEAFTGILRASA
jgi:hypothetical protein